MGIASEPEIFRFGWSNKMCDRPYAVARLLYVKTPTRNDEKARGTHVRLSVSPLLLHRYPHCASA